jgi:hypothetical protein
MMMLFSYQCRSVYDLCCNLGMRASSHDYISKTTMSQNHLNFP